MLKVLQVSDVVVRRGDRVLIDGMSFDLASGQQALIVGPNGSGKTSFLRMLAGLAPVTSGRIELDGEPIGRLVPAERGRLIYQAHLDGFKKELTITENLRFALGIRGRADASLQANVLEQLALDQHAERPVKTLSAGQRRRAALALLRLAGAPLWILDEPLTNLDEEGRELVRSWLGTHLADGGLAIVATHQPELLAAPGTVVVEL